MTSKRQQCDTNNIGSRHHWTFIEDAKLVECLVEMANMGPRWKGSHGTFKPGYLNHIEKWMKEKIPGTSIKAQPHIESRLKILKRQYHAISEMLGTDCSGFGWDESNKCITCELHTFNTWVKSHPTAAGLRNKAFPHYNDLAAIFGKDRVNGVNYDLDAIDCKDRANGVNAEGPSNVARYIEMGNINNEIENVGMNEHAELQEDLEDATSADNMSSGETSKRNRKRARSNDPLVEKLVDNMVKLSSLYEGVSENIKLLAQTFQREADGANRRMKLHDELLTIAGLNDDEILKVGEIIISDTNKVDYFFSLKGHFRKKYVLNLLEF